jgi:glyoxylase-like metal-dependent hydrolase (beta-lactamase superfamily II)
LIVERVEHPQWLSNAYLVSDGATGVLIDSNGLEARLERRVTELGIELTHVLCTHGHPDHVVDVEDLARRHDVPLVAHPRTRVAAAARIEDGETMRSGAFEIRALYTPGHCADHVAYLVDGSECFTADVLFRGTVGGTSGPDGDYAALRHSILDVLLALPPETAVHPGHREATTLAAERQANPFVRAWLDGEWPEPEDCRVNGEPAMLLLWADDYDGGHKALVRFADGRETIVGGSRVER